jgi:hypothetical protein
MATARPFAYNPPPNAVIAGTEQVGSLAIGTPTSGFTNNPQFWNGPDEELGYVIAVPVSGNTQPTQVPDDKITLSTTYKGTDIALSNNNQTASQIFSYSQTVLGETIISGTNKVMFSVQYTSTNPSVGVGGHFIGVGLTNMNYSGPFDGYPGNDIYSIGFSDDGNYYFDGGSVQSGLPTWTNGDIIDIAISSGQYWWIRVNGGNWNNSPSANPTTGANGSVLNGLSNFYPALCPYIYGTMQVLNYPKYGVPTDYNFLGNVSASVGFLGTKNMSSPLSEATFVELTNSSFNQNFTTGNDASTWLTTNGYWNSFTVNGGNGLTPETAGDNALQIKTDYSGSTDGLYWIKNDNISGGTPFQIYADMTTDGGGWTLLVTNQNTAGWTYANSILLNEFNPVSGGSNYSIVAYADYLKSSGATFQYMIDANQRNQFGGIWSAPSTYTFLKTDNTQTNITIDIKFGTWNYNDSSIEQYMPWRSTSSGLLTTSSNPGGEWWGTLITNGGWSPAPWINGDCGLDGCMPAPGIIWYWVR